MLVGPRMRDGEQGYIVVTPLEREGDDGAKVLVNRGWISKANAEQSKRPAGLPQGEVRVEGMLRQPWKKNMFTPVNRPDKREFYFPDVQQMAALTGSQAVWIEQTMGRLPDLVHWLWLWFDTDTNIATRTGLLPVPRLPCPWRSHWEAG
jgi:surfeit locus 1 family protein